MKFINGFASGIPVETVHVLGDYPVDEISGFHLRQYIVGRIGLDPAKQFIKNIPHHLPGLSRIFTEIGDIKGGRIIFIPQSIFTPEGGNATFHRDTGPGKGNGPGGSLDEICCP